MSSFINAFFEYIIMKKNKQFAVRSVTEKDFRSIYIRKKCHITGHKAAIYALDKANEANTIYSGGGDGLVVKWDLDRPETGQVVAQVKSNIFSLKYIPTLHRLAIGNMFGGVHWIDLHTSKNIKNVQVHEKGVFDIQWINGHIYTAGGQGKLTKWSAEDCRPLETIQLSNKSLRRFHYSSIHNEIAIGSSDYSIYILNADDLSIKKVIKNAHNNSVFTVQYSPDGQFLMSGGRDAFLRVWDLSNNYELISEQPAHWFTINQIVFSPDQTIFATASRDKSIKIWDAQTFKILKVIERVRSLAHTHSINSLFWQNENEWLISCSDDRSIMGWDIMPTPDSKMEKQL